MPRRRLCSIRPLSPSSGRGRALAATLAAGLLAWALAGATGASGQSAGSPTQSSWIRVSPAGAVWSLSDTRGNRIPDFSTVGYAGGEREPPLVPVRQVVVPGPGDDTARIQQALDTVAALPIDASGFRGAVLLAPGEFQISNQVTIRASGVVLRGSGRGTNGTLLRATGRTRRTVILVAGGGAPETVPNTTHDITDPYVPVGAHALTVESTDGLAVGDRILVRRNANDAWIRDLGMDLLCCPPEVNPWKPSGYQIDMDRRIVGMEGNTLFLDAPVVCAIETRYGGGTVRRFTWEGRIRNVGLEDLEGVSDFTAPDDEDHAWTFIHLQAVEDAWVRRVTARHFGFAAVSLGRGARHVTVSECEGLDPVSQVTGGRRYAFVMDDCELCLVRDCRTRNDRHQFVTQSLTTGPNVFVDGLSENAWSDAGPHHRWATGALWDNVEVQGHDLNVQNRGNLGSGHGWAGANCVVWNSRARGFVVQNPPGARNWLIGSAGTLKEGTVYVGPHDPGTVDQHGAPVFPRSLYHAQLQHRLHLPGLQIREYRTGLPDAFDPLNPPDGETPLDPAWAEQVRARAGTQPVGRLDEFKPGQWVPFTILWTPDPGLRVAAAALQICLRTASSPANPTRLYLDTLTNGIPVDNLPHSPAEPDGSVVYLLDLEDRLPQLADGRLDVAVHGDVAVDWAMLELRLVPASPEVQIRIQPAADTWVREPPGDADNHAGDALLAVGRDPQPGNERRAFLLWRTDRLPSNWVAAIRSARVELAPVAAGSTMEQALACAAGPPRAEAMTWLEQPGLPPPLASWIPQPGRKVSAAVTPQLRAALEQGWHLVVGLTPSPRSPWAGHATYAAREYPALQARPWLAVSLQPGAVPRPRFRSVRLNASALEVEVEQHVPGARYRALFHPRPVPPLTGWTTLREDVFPEDPVVRLTLPVPDTHRTGFFALELF